MKNTIGSLLLLQVYLFGLMAATSCSKNESEVVNDTTTPAAEFAFYQYTQIPGSDPNNGLVAKQVLNQTGDEIFFYGSFDEAGLPQTPKSFVVQRASSDTLMNVFVDAFMRPTMVYFSNRNGTKYSTLWTYEYTSDYTFLFRAFTYDWTTDTDNLNYESMVTFENGQYSFQDNFVRSSQDKLDITSLFRDNVTYRGGEENWPILADAIGTALGVGLTAVVGIYGAVAYGTAVGLLGAAILGGSLLISTANAAEELFTNNNTELPPNPNDSPNPTPESTPDDPTNLTTTTTSTTDLTSTTGTSGTTVTTGTTSTSSTTSTSDSLSTTGVTGTTGTTGTVGTTSTTGTTGDSVGMTVGKPRLSHQLRRELYDNRQSKK